MRECDSKLQTRRNVVVLTRSTHIKTGYQDEGVIMKLDEVELEEKRARLFWQQIEALESSKVYHSPIRCISPISVASNSARQYITKLTPTDKIHTTIHKISMPKENTLRRSLQLTLSRLAAQDNNFNFLQQFTDAL